jgi:hypothetical protein
MASYIPAIVLQKNNTVFIGNSGITTQKSAGTEITVGLGLATTVPTPDDGAVIDSDYWAVPVGEGVLTSIKYTPYNANDPVTSVKPNVQAFAVCRIYNRFASDYWYVLGTVAQYITASGGGAALPTTLTTLLAPYQVMCQFDENAKYFAVFALPTLVGNQRYFPWGYFFATGKLSNGVALAAGANTGYLTPGTLLTFLNANWNNVGTWTLSADNQTLRVEQTAGDGNDIIAAQIAAINPSL